MKIRTDFVSNSSSCSFIIDKNLSRFGKIMQIFSDVDIPYSFEDDIRINIYVKYKNYIHVREDLIKLGYYNKDDFYYLDESVIIKNIKENPEEVSWNPFTLHFSGLSELGDLYDYFEHIDFSSDDYGSGILHLKMLYDFYKNNNCDPDVTESEQEFVQYSSKSFYGLLSQKVEIWIIKLWLMLQYLVNCHDAKDIVACLIKQSNDWVVNKPCQSGSICHQVAKETRLSGHIFLIYWLRRSSLHQRCVHRCRNIYNPFGHQSAYWFCNPLDLCILGKLLLLSYLELVPYMSRLFWAGRMEPEITCCYVWFFYIHLVFVMLFSWC